MLATMYPPQDKVSHVIFDLDGLLINSENFYEAADKVVLQALGKAYSVDLEWKLRGRTDLDCAKMIVDYYRLDMTPEEWHTLGTSIYSVASGGILLSRPCVTHFTLGANQNKLGKMVLFYAILEKSRL